MREPWGRIDGIQTGHVGGTPADVAVNDSALWVATASPDRLLGLRL